MEISQYMRTLRLFDSFRIIFAAPRSFVVKLISKLTGARWCDSEFVERRAVRNLLMMRRNMPLIFCGRKLIITHKLPGQVVFTLWLTDSGRYQGCVVKLDAAEQRAIERQPTSIIT